MLSGSPELLFLKMDICFGKFSAEVMDDRAAGNSSTLAWKIPWMEEPGRLQSMGSLRVRHN